MTWLLYEKGEIGREALFKMLLPYFPELVPLECTAPIGKCPVCAEDLVLIYASLNTLRNMVATIAAKDAVLAVLPREDNRVFTQAFHLPKRMDAAVQKILHTAPSQVDLLDVNGLPVFSHVTLGEMSQLRPKTANGDTPTLRSWFKAFKESVTQLKQLRFQSITLKTEKGQQLQTAAMGITVIENSNSPILRHVLEEELDSYDGRLNAFIWAPRSIFALMWYWLRLGVFGKFRTGSLPDSIGFIQSTRVEITSNRPLEFSIDGTTMGSRLLEASVKPAALKVIQGNSFVEPATKQEDKESFKVAHLPRGEAAQALMLEPMPLFSRAAEEEFRDLFLQVRQSAVPGRSFFILMILSTVLAAMGLFLNSASVIIGAMILAPLMAPIISLAMAAVRSNRELILQSLRTLFSGIGVAIVIASLISALMPLELVTAEMRSRLNPNLLDLIVAIVSGIAGAYAHAREDVAKSLAGVAIAVALVPPLTVTGIGIGFADLQMVLGSFLLFTTNLVGIVIAASVTFLVLGFAPLRMAKKGLAVTGILLAAIVPPLLLGFSSMTLQSSVAKQLVNRSFTSQRLSATIEQATVIQNRPLEVALKLSVNDTPMPEDFDWLKGEIERTFGRDLTLRISYEVVR
ncbi:MAG: TIGR00341 family protein [Sulfurimonadaceae bacterium]|nr:TIGR00341 family protein [Sulfurimonadaceae bacterium]